MPPDEEKPKRKRRSYVKIPRMTEEQLKTLALEYERKEVYIAITPEDMISFEFVLLMWGEHVTPRTAKQIGAVYEHYHDEFGRPKTAPRAINGKPMFFSARFIHIDDMPVFIEKLKAVEEALGKI